MKRRKNWNIHPKYILAVFSVVCVVLVVLSFKYESKFASFKSSLGDVMTPMQKGINYVGSFFSDKIDLVATKEELLKENEELKAQVEELTYDNKILVQEKNEGDELRRLYELDTKYPDYHKVAARVVGRDSNNWYNTFVIDKGTADGIQKDMNVIAGEGLVGIVAEAGKHYSKVRSIIDDKSNVSAMFLKTSDTCIVKGNLESIFNGVIDVEMINKEAKIENGYEVVTSHISTKYLQGILIGYVSDISDDPTSLTKTAKLTPVVSFDKLETVLIITQLKDSKESEDVLKNDQETD